MVKLCKNYILFFFVGLVCSISNVQAGDTNGNIDILGGSVSCPSKYHYNKIAGDYLPCPTGAFCTHCIVMDCNSGYEKKTDSSEYHGYDCVRSSSSGSGSGSSIASGSCSSTQYGGINPYCKACPTNATCNGQWFTCNDHYVQIGATTCNACPAGCKKCTTTHSCDTCYDPLVWIEAKGACGACPANATCSGSRYVCNSGFTDDGNGNCISTSCPAGKELYKGECLEVVLQDTYQNYANSTQTACKPDGYIYNEGQYTALIKCTIEEGKGGCNAPGQAIYYRDIVCTSCPSYATCDGHTYSCNTGYIDDGNGICYKDGCEDNQWENSSGVCTACPANATCDGIDYLCNTGYIDDGNGICSKNVCASNQYGTYPNCKSCPTNGRCTGASGYTCNTGYTDDGNGTCVKDNCPAHADCFGGDNYTCHNGFYDTGSDCKSIVTSSCPTGTKLSSDKLCCIKD